MSGDVLPVTTNAGLAAMGEGPGQINLNITHLVIGSEHYKPSVTDTEIRQPIKTLQPLDDFQASEDGVLTLNFLWDGPETGVIGSTGIYAGDTLYCVYSDPSGPMFIKSAGEERTFHYDLRFLRADLERIQINGVGVNFNITVASELLKIEENNQQARESMHGLESRIHQLEIAVDALKRKHERLSE